MFHIYVKITAINALKYYCYKTSKPPARVRSNSHQTAYNTSGRKTDTHLVFMMTTMRSSRR